MTQWSRHLLILFTTVLPSMTKINTNFNWGSNFTCFQFSFWLKTERVKHLSFEKQKVNSLGRDSASSCFGKKEEIGCPRRCSDILILSTKMAKWKGQIWISSQNKGKSRLKFHPIWPQSTQQIDDYQKLIAVAYRCNAAPQPLRYAPA